MKTNRSHHRAASIFAIGLATSFGLGPANALVTAFDVPGELAANYSVGGDISQQMTNGITGGCVSVTTDSSGWATHPGTAYDFTQVGTVLNASGFFIWGGSTLPPNYGGDAFSIGFTGNGDEIAGYPSDVMSVDIYASNHEVDGLTVKLGYNTGSQGGIVSDHLSLTVGNWYLLSATFEHGEDTFNPYIKFNGFVQDYGLNGLTPGAVVGSMTKVEYAWSPTVPETTLLADDSMYGGFTMKYQAGGRYADNFQASQIPEPTTAGLLGLQLSSVAFLGFRRR